MQKNAMMQKVLRQKVLRQTALALLCAATLAVAHAETAAEAAAAPAVVGPTTPPPAVIGPAAPAPAVEAPAVETPAVQTPAVVGPTAAPAEEKPVEEKPEEKPEAKPEEKPAEEKPADEKPALPDKQAFATGDGAFSVFPGGDFVDPYFVNKALIVGIEAGQDLQQEVQQWLDWLLPRQRGDGGFDRFCREGQKNTAEQAQNQNWLACKRADADDSMLATFLQLLSMSNQRNWLGYEQYQRALKASERAHAFLLELHDSKTGLFKVYPERELFYLMDNAEVYDALMATGHNARARELAKAIRSQFFRDGSWTPAIPPYEKENFYPHTLAQTFLWTNHLIAEAEAGATLAAWLSQHGAIWLKRKADEFSWGLVAWQIRRTAPALAACWRASLRHPAPPQHWTLLDAAVDSALAHIHILPSQCADNAFKP